MKITQIKIDGIGGIEDITLQFDKRMNIICGPNGVGKTTVLECIAHSFSGHTSNILKRNASCENGQFHTEVEIDNQPHAVNIVVNELEPDKRSNINGLQQNSNKLLSLKVNRTFQYTPLQAVGKDVEKELHIMYEEAKTGVKIDEVKNWFVNRYLYSAHKGTLSKEQLHNLEIAKKSFSLLHPSFSFSKVFASSNEIMVNSPNGEIYYEYLSSGFKSSLSIIFGIIKDIELRFKNPFVKVDEFGGVVLIDEIELHLHPEWQTKIANVLLKVFPKVQFIVTTHSPHVLQNAKPNQIIALATNGTKVIKRELSENQFGFQGWTVEEILEDVMGLSDTRTGIYQDYIKKFEHSIESEDYVKALELFEKLDSLLHPNNHLRKLLKLDLETIKGLNDD